MPNVPTGPPELAAAIAQAQGRVESGWREGARGYVRVAAPAGTLFGRWSDDAADAAVLGHEAEIVGMLAGRSGPLAAPALVAHGHGWLLESHVEAGPLRGENVAVAAAAGAEIPALELPEGPGGGGSRWAPRAHLRRLRVVRSQVPLRELLRARTLLRRSPLPWAPSHGDLHGGNVLVAEGRAHVIDWELSGERLLGWDLMQLWVTLDDPGDRAVVLETALGLVGEAHRSALLELRYVLAVRTAAAALGAPEGFDRDVQRGRRLVSQLATLRGA